MFKRFRRALIKYGVNGNIAVVEHMCENLFFAALIVAKSVVWSDSNKDWYYYHGPIICFVCVTIAESVNLYDWRKLLVKGSEGQVDEGMSSSVNKSRELSKQFSAGSADDDESGGMKSKGQKEEEQDELWERIEKVNDHFFDITATIIIYVSILSFLANYSFGDTKEEEKAGCLLGETFDDEYDSYYYYYDDNDKFWFNGTFGTHDDIDDDTKSDDAYKKANKHERVDGGEVVGERETCG
jgi:hypothetical protein